MKKQKFIILIEIIILISLGLISIILEISNENVNKYNNWIFDKENELIYYQNMMSNNILRVTDIGSMKLFGVQPNKLELNELSGMNFGDDEIKNIIISYSNGSISSKEFLDKEHKYHNKIYNQYVGLFNEANSELETLKDEKIKCFRITECNLLIQLLRISQILLLILGLLGYLILFLDIK